MSQQQSAKSPAVAWALWFFLGGFGAHRFFFFGKNNIAFAMLGAGFATAIAQSIFGLVAALPLLGWWVFDAFQVKKWLDGEQPAAPSEAGVDLLHASPDTPPVAEFQDADGATSRSEAA